MQFNSYVFAAFFAVVLAIHHAPLPWRTRKRALLAESYLFYAAWDPPFVLLLMGSTVLDWVCARAIARAASPGRRRALLGLSLGFNLGVLVAFKYASFALASLQAFLVGLGLEVQFAAPDLVLPIGISFYTFQTLSYTLDVYLRRAQPIDSLADYALFVTFFPQLVAGPIVRAVQLVPQLVEPRRASGAAFGWGLSLIVLGVFEKNVIADVMMAPAVEAVFQPGILHADFGQAWIGALGFAGQIFCDFAGYSTAAIGAAMCLGFALPDNFRFPYAAIGFSDFWRRWHISLSSWLRDYLYVPLGGNRHGPSRTQLNLMLTMLIGGLWHGASWTFVAWGGLHGTYLVVERALRARVGQRALWRRAPVRLALAALTFALVCVAWVLFRAVDFAQAFVILRGMVGAGQTDAAIELARSDVLLVVVPLAALLASHWLLRDTSLEAAVARLPWPVRAAALAALLFAIAAMPGEDRAFIYFQF